MRMVSVEGGNVCVTVPMCFKTESGRHVSVPVGRPAGAPEAFLASNVILQACARARAWLEMLDRGLAPSVIELARRLGIDRANMSKQLRLGTLSPRIIRSVMDGTAPSGISLQKLVAIRSDDWDEQEAEIGLGRR